MDESDMRTIAARHDLPVEAIETLAAALRRGGRRQAQFSHPALGGMGQWSRGGGIMIGDMFNHDLKARVARACDDLADQIGDDPGLDAGHAADGGWWPSDLGRPASVGSQNAQGYAFFPEARRLAIRAHDGVRLFDTKDHRITGVSQQSNGTGGPSFHSQHGEVRLDALEPVDAPQPHDRGTQATEAPGSRQQAQPSDRDGERPGPHDALATIERLHDLHRKGVLTDAEFADKKKDLLARL